MLTKSLAILAAIVSVSFAAYFVVPATNAKAVPQATPAAPQDFAAFRARRPQLGAGPYYHRTITRKAPNRPGYEFYSIVRDTIPPELQQ